MTESSRSACRMAGLAVLGLLLTTACSSSGGPPNAGDPRKGRTTVQWSNCATGSCLYDWKVCIGPDLHMHVDGAKPEDYTLKNNSECAP